VVGGDPFLTTSIIGGDPPDGYPVQGIWVEDISYGNYDVSDVDPFVSDIVTDVKSDQRSDGLDPALNAYYNVQRQVIEVLDRGDALHREFVAEPNMPLLDDMNNETRQGLENLYNQTTTLLYRGLKTSVVSATIVIHNMCVGFRNIINFTSKLLRYLSENLLSEGNKLPNSHYEAAKSIQIFYLDYNIIHAYSHECVLYEGDHA
jgi:hypothetical protein